MKTRIFYNQDAGNGGGSAPSSPAQSVAAPSDAGSGSADPQASFASQLREITSGKTQQNAQPASDGKKPEPKANGDEGADGGHEAEDQSTTADGKVTDPEGKGAENKWSEDDRKFLEAQGYKDLAWTPEIQKIVKSQRELRSEFDRVSGSNTNAITQAETMRQAVWRAANGDISALQKEFGIDLKLDQRTPEVMLKEILSQGEEFKGVMQGLLDQYLQQGNDAAAKGVVDAWNALAAKLDAKAGIIQEESRWQQRESEWLKKAGKAADPKDAYTELSGKARTNLAALTQEDPQAAQWFKAIEDETKPGGALASLNIDLPRAYGSSLQTARFMNKVGKALLTLQNMPQILADERKRAEADFERKQSQGGTRGSTTGGSARGASPSNPVIASLQSMMTAAASQRR